MPAELPQFMPIPKYSNLSKEQFFSEIVPLQQPAILKGVVKHWPAVQQGTASVFGITDYLHAFSQQKAMRVAIGDASINGRFFYTDDMQGLNFSIFHEFYEKIYTRFKAAITHPSAPAIAVQGVTLNDFFPGFSSANPVDFFDDTIKPKLWLGNKVTVSAHYDGSDNLACVVSGRRRFILFPPNQISNLYPGPLDFTPAGAPVSMVSLHAPDFVRYPRYQTALAHAQMAELEPGDAIFIPMLWWHHVDSLGEINALVNYWWNGSIGNPHSKPTPVEALGMAILAMSQLTPLQRAAWHALYAHYLFKTGDDPVDYLPANRLGILGEISPAMEVQIKQWFAELLAQK